MRMPPCGAKVKGGRHQPSPDMSNMTSLQMKSIVGVESGVWSADWGVRSAVSEKYVSIISAILLNLLSRHLTEWP